MNWRIIWRQRETSSVTQLANSGCITIPLISQLTSFLFALAQERTRAFDEDYRRRHALGVSSTVNSAKTKLMEDGHVEVSNGEFVVADPFFARFLREV